jgi:hypothetical protein
LAEKLNQEQYTAIRDAVSVGNTKTKKSYTDASLFLILESMGGTWKMYLDRVKGKKPPEQTVNTFNLQLSNETKAWEADRDLVLRQMLYDLTMWFSIRNNPKKTRYLSHNASEFIAAFGLDTDETANGTIYSTDDEDGPGGPDAGATSAVQPQPDDINPSSSRNSRPARAGSFTRPATPTGVRRPIKRPDSPELRRAFEQLEQDKKNTAKPPPKKEDPDQSERPLTAQEREAIKNSVGNARERYEDELETPRLPLSKSPLPQPKSPRAK